MTPTQDDYSDFVKALFKDMKDPTLNLLHAAVGISGEAGELLDAVKKHWAYEKPLDRANVIEELGDLEFYMQAMRNELGIPRAHILQANVAKLSKRYAALHYSNEAAQARADKTHQEETFQPIMSEGSKIGVRVPACPHCNHTQVFGKTTECFNCGKIIP